MTIRRLFFLFLPVAVIWAGISLYTASSKPPAPASDGWLDGFLNQWKNFFGQSVSPDQITLKDASGNSYRCTGHYKYPLKIETSGLFYDEKSKKFYSVADKGAPQIYEFIISGRGVHIRSSWSVRDQKNIDFEGIALLHILGVRSLLIAAENTTASNEGRVLIVDPVSRRVSSNIKVDLGSPSTRNANFEGIAVNNRRKQIYLAKERNPLALYLLDHKGRLIDSMNQKELLGLYRRFAVARKVPHRLGGPISASLSGLDFEEHTGILAILNRSHRQIVLAVNRGKDALDLEIIDILTYRIPENSPFGNAEGIAVADFGKGRSLILITDPGPGGRPAVTVFDYPKKGRKL